MQTQDGLCFCGSGEKHADCHSDIHADSVCAHVLYNLADIDTRISCLASQQRIEPYCKKGCNDCCQDYFYISETEYFALRYSLLKKGVLREKISIGKQQLRILRDKNPAEYQALLTKETRASAHTEHQFHMCPLNDEDDGSCEHYLYRPPICRIHGYTGEFGVCAKMKRALTNVFGTPDVKKIEKHMIDAIIMEQQHCAYNSCFYLTVEPLPYPFQVEVMHRPLFYWLATDNEQSLKYEDAISLSSDAYCSKYYFEKENLPKKKNPNPKLWRR